MSKSPSPRSLSLPLIRRKLTFRLGEYPSDLQEVDSVSVTVPDDTLSIRDILSRYAAGIMPMGREGFFDGDIFVPDLSSLDLVELQDLREQSLATIQEQETLHAEYSRKLAEKEAEEAFERELEKRMSLKKDDPSDKKDGAT